MKKKTVVAFHPNEMRVYWHKGGELSVWRWRATLKSAWVIEAWACDDEAIPALLNKAALRWKDFLKTLRLGKELQKRRKNEKA